MERELIILWAGIVAYVLGGSLAIGGVVLGKRPERSVLALIVIGFTLHTLAIAFRWERLGQGPFVSMFEILSSNLWSLVLVFALAYWRIPAIRPSAAVVMPILFVMMGWLVVSSPGEVHLPRSFRTPWLYIHVGLGKVFLGAMLVAVGLAGVIQARRSVWGSARFLRLPEDSRLDELAYRFMALALVFNSLMLVAGAIWAQDAWGRYWAWDPLETWAFITWLLLALALHLRVTFKPSARVSSLMAFAVFGIAFLTFFGVPFISQSPHKGTF
ncbi:MAG: cytochrome c biogenesis protein CcsA [Burkholderiaceae bacterium]|nr:cytochrome c biogenesis protein CcsA [Burkholderiaceae bacterium]